MRVGTWVVTVLVGVGACFTDPTVPCGELRCPADDVLCPDDCP